MQNEKALKGYRKARDAEGLAKIKEKTGDYDGAIRLLLKHHRVIDALKRASTYENRRIPVKISECYRVHYLASKYAQKLCLQRSENDLQQFKAVVEFLTPPERVPFYIAAHMHEEACDILKTEGRYSELFRIYKAQGWNDEGIQVARSSKHHEDEATFVFFKATAELAGESGQLEDSTVVMLKKKLDNQSEVGAKASLIYGFAVQNDAKIKTARDIYTNRKCQNSFGRIEAFNAAIARVHYDSNSQTWRNIDLNVSEDLLSLTLSICKEIKHVTTTLDSSEEPSTEQKQVCSQFESFYGLERCIVGEELREVYSVPSSSYPWTNRLLKVLEVGEMATDADGMLQLEIESVFKSVSLNMENFIQTWIVDDKLHLVEHFSKLLTSHPLHHKIAAGGYLLHSEGTQENYFRLLCNAFDLASYGSSKVGSQEDLFRAVLNAISPQATCYLPVATTFLKIHSNSLIEMMKEQAISTLTTSDHSFNFDTWFEAWRMNCVSRIGSKRMKEILIRRSNSVDVGGYKRQRSQGTPQVSIPPVYVFDLFNRQYQHIILLWLRACETFHQKATLTSCTIAVNRVILHVASKQSLWKTVSVSNLLNMATIHTIAILTMHAACSARFGQVGCIYFPYAYKNVVEVFRNMSEPADKDFFRSCILHIMKRNKLPEVPPKLQKMLTTLMRVMIGLRYKEFNPLRDALGNEKCLENGEARHCLVFVLTLFCNIALIDFNPQVLQNYRIQIYESIKHCNDPSLMRVYQFLNSHTLLGCCGALRELLELSKDNLLQANLAFNYRLNDVEIKFDPATLTTPNFEKRLLHFPAKLAPQHSKTVTIRSSLNVEAKPFHPTSEEPSNLAPESLTVPAIEPEFLTMDSTEAEEDDLETGEALKYEEEQVAPQPETDKNPTEDFNFCFICAYSIADSAHPEPDPNSNLAGATSKESLYRDHCRTEKHLTNGKIKDRFDTEEKESFNPKKNELLELLPRSKSLYRFRQDEKLRQTVDGTENNIKEMDKFIKEIRYSAEWRAGVQKLEYDYSGKLDSLRMTLNRLIEETEEIKKKIQKDEEQQEKKDEEEVQEDDELEEDEDIEQAHAEVGKVKSRRRKKERRAGRSRR
jgi:hypothetical protein